MSRTLPDIAGTRHMIDLSNDGVLFDTSVFTGENNPDGTGAIGWPGRDLYAVNATTVDNLQPRPGVAGFTLILWIYTDPVNVNPNTSFPDYRIVQLNDDDVDASTSAACAWAVAVSGTDQISLNQYSPTTASAALTVTSGWHMYAWTCDCAAGAAPIKSYKDGVLIATGANNVTAAVDTTTFRYPAISLGAHQGGTQKTVTFGTGDKVSHFSIFDTALTAPQLLTAYGVMTA